MLLADKTRPKSLDRLDYNKALTNKLHTLSTREDLPHLLFYGPSGAGFFLLCFLCFVLFYFLSNDLLISGKKTRVMCLLKAIYGSGVEKLRLEMRSFKTPSKKQVDISMVGSNYHLGLYICVF